MKLKVLTANIAFGLKNMDSLWTNIVGHLYFHGASMILFILYPQALKSKKDNVSRARTSYLHRQSDLASILNVIQKENADIIILNEVVGQIHENKLREMLDMWGYKSIYISSSQHYSDATVSSLVAAKFPGKPVQLYFPQEIHPGGGGGLAALRLENNLTVAAIHICALRNFLDFMTNKLRRSLHLSRKKKRTIEEY